MVLLEKLKERITLKRNRRRWKDNIERAIKFEREEFKSKGRSVKHNSSNVKHIM